MAKQQMGEGDRHPVRGIGWGGSSLEAQQFGHHESDLRFERGAPPHDGLLDLSWGVLENRDPRFGACQEDDPAGVAEHRHRTDVGPKENIFDGKHVGGMAIEQLGQSFVDREEAERKSGSRRGSNDPAFHQPGEPAWCIGYDHPITDDSGSRVDAKHLHRAGDLGVRFGQSAGVHIEVGGHLGDVIQVFEHFD